MAKRFCFLIGYLLLLVVPLQAAPKRPNVLFFAVDDLRPELGCYGNTRIKSPNIDRLAARSVVFRRAYCQQAVCSPSRTSLLTGLRPDSTKVYDLQTHFRDTVPDVVTLPQHFKNHGYYTVGMGKIYHSGLNDPLSWSEPWRRPSRVVTYARPENVDLVRKKRREAKARGLRGKALSRAARGPAFECADVPDNTYHDGALADMAIQTLRRIKDRPFFLAVGFIKPHLPFVAPKKYWDLYRPEEMKLADNPFPPKNSPKYALTNWGELRAYDGIPKQGPLSEAIARQLVHGYYAATSYTDAQVGRVLNELDRLGLRENTIVILWGDHGWKLGEHGAWCKHTNFELDTNAPLILHVPGAKANGQTCEALVEFVDIYPTLCEAAGLPLPEHLEGTSMLPLTEQPDQPWKKAAFSQYPRGRVMGYSMRTDRYRFTMWVQRKDPSVVEAVELYDHQIDPAENVNVAGEADYKPIVERLTRQLRAGWQAARPGPIQ
ncbi:MAG: sulfatase [Planctomycetes bacterium]|nr:sulfatase [Planctomycetota bacterium]